jgi:hypothetical protein
MSSCRVAVWVRSAAIVVHGALHLEDLVDMRVEVARETSDGTEPVHVEPPGGGVIDVVADVEVVKKLNGATFFTPSASTVDTQAMGRGTTQPMRSLYTASALIFSGSNSTVSPFRVRVQKGRVTLAETTRAG